MDKALSFDDVLLTPKYSNVFSRKEISLDTYVTDQIHLQVPIISSNMPSVTNWEIAVEMWKLGGMGILHRFNTIQEALSEYLLVRNEEAEAGVSLGVGEDTIERAAALYKAGARIFCVDVAHGHHLRVTMLIENLRHIYGEEIEIIAGNIATGVGCAGLAEAGADAIKVGIGPGAACTTREVSGFGVPQLSAIFECAQAKELYPGLRIIADGGIKNSGDIVKALVFGADAVMLGRLLAGAAEAPYPGEYFGSASDRVRAYRAPEGISGEVEIEGTLEDIVKKLCWGIKSGLSYAGCASIDDLHFSDIDYMVVSPQTMNETRTRI